jgi:hypothetical protein
MPIQCDESSLRVEYTKREDITFIAFQLWVLGMSIVAVSVGYYVSETFLTQSTTASQRIYSSHVFDFATLLCIQYHSYASAA